MKHILLSFFLMACTIQFPKNLAAHEGVLIESHAPMVNVSGPGAVIFFLDQLHDHKKIALLDFLNKFESRGNPIVEFSSLNPAKYYLNINDIEANFIINFAEKFHKSWKIYPVRPHGEPIDRQSLISSGKYKILENNADFQASYMDVVHFIDRGWLSGMGVGGKIRFISKKFYNSIQNNNLSAGSPFETFKKRSWVEDYHVPSNSFSNAWLIDIKYLKFHFPGVLISTSEGKFKAGFIIEFSPQKTLLVTLLISGTFISGCFIYILVRVGRKLGGLYF